MCACAPVSCAVTCAELWRGHPWASLPREGPRAHHGAHTVPRTRDGHRNTLSLGVHLPFSPEAEALSDFLFHFARECRRTKIRDISQTRQPTARRDAHIAFATANTRDSRAHFASLLQLHDHLHYSFTSETGPHTRMNWRYKRRARLRLLLLVSPLGFHTRVSSRRETERPSS